MKTKGQPVADDGFDKNVAEKMPKVKREDDFSSPEVGSQRLKEEDPEGGQKGRDHELEAEEGVVLEPVQSREKKEPSDVSEMIEDLHAEILILGKAKRALEIDLASGRRTIFQLAQDNRELRRQVEDLSREIQKLRAFESERLYLKDENADALEKIRDLTEELRGARESLESAIRQRDEALARIHELESQTEEKEVLRIKGKLKEREAFHLTQENRELRGRLEEMLSENIDLEKKYEEMRRSFNEIRESLTLLRDSCKTGLYSLPECSE